MLSFKGIKDAIDIVLDSNHVPNIVGLQGIGKTDLVREYALERDMEFEEVTCSLLQEGDLAMPYMGNDGVEYSVNNVIRKLVKRCLDSGRKGLLFLDEFNRAAEKAQSELMNLVLQRRIIDYKLPDCIRLVIAMNPNSGMKGYENTNYAVFESDKAIMGRVLTLHMSPSLPEWLDYGHRLQENGETLVHPFVLGFLKANSNLFVTPEVEGCLNNTPRGWKCASDVLYSWDSKNYTGNNLLLNLLNGTLEENSAGKLLSYIERNKKSIDYYKIAKKTLNADSVQDWDKIILQMNDAELNKVMKFMCEFAKDANNDKWISNVCSMVVYATADLAYSWISLLQRSYDALYTKMLSVDETFANRALELVMDVKATEVGGFSGK